VATHDFNLVTRYATRLVLLNAGSLVAEGPRDMVLRPGIIQDVFQVDVELAATKAGEPVYVFHQRIAG
jgi:iron complex transport system ATP-binding protein